MPVLPAVAFDDNAAGPQLALLRRIIDDEQGRPVLDGLTGVHEFGLAEDGAAGRFRNSLELDQRGVANRFGNSVGKLHGYALSGPGENPGTATGNKAIDNAVNLGNAVETICTHDQRDGYGYSPIFSRNRAKPVRRFFCRRRLPLVNLVLR